MRNRDYGQFCGLARAAEVIGQRWALLILRDLLVGPRRYSDLRAGLPGIPTNILATRLKELEGDGLVTREARSGLDRSIVYVLTPRGEAIAPALDELARWGAAGMRTPRPDEVVTDASLATALRVAAGKPAPGLRANVTVRVQGAAAHAAIGNGTVSVGPGEHPDPSLVITGGLEFRDILAGELDARTAVADGLVEVDGDERLLEEVLAVFSVPYGEGP